MNTQHNILCAPIVTASSYGLVRDRITCVDGATISVQASSMHYCTPRSNTGPYSHVEVGFPSADFPAAAEYKEDTGVSDSDTVFACVPVELVAAWIKSRGGVDFNA